MATQEPAAGGGRPAYSHVNADGQPKRVLTTSAEAKAYVVQLETDTGAAFGYYLCGERPEHFHVSRARPR